MSPLRHVLDLSESEQPARKPYNAQLAQVGQTIMASSNDSGPGAGAREWLAGSAQSPT